MPKGAVVGPLVIAGVLINEKDESKLRIIGVRDSKMLSANRREHLYTKIKKMAKRIIVIKISAQEIDDRRKLKNLNKIEADQMAHIIKMSGGDIAVVDAPQVSTEKFKQYLMALAKNHTDIISENYADKNHPVVSAASIIAKVERDAEIDKIKKIVGEDFGVGYSHDKRTIDFVKRCLKDKKHLEYIRHSWITVTDMKGKSKQKNLESF